MAETRLISQAVYVRKGGSLDSLGTIGINTDDILSVNPATCFLDPAINTAAEIVCKKGKKYYSASSVSTIITAANS
jgi:hypothetical protein